VAYWSRRRDHIAAPAAPQEERFTRRLHHSDTIAQNLLTTLTMLGPGARLLAYTSRVRKRSCGGKSSYAR